VRSIRTESRGGHRLNTTFEKHLEQVYEAREATESLHGGPEFDEDIYVAIRARLVAHCRAEEGKPVYPEAPNLGLRDWRPWLARSG
jgi:hypothetical protein